MRKDKAHKWVFNGECFEVGNDLTVYSDINTIYPVVWFKNKLYNVVYSNSKKVLLEDLRNEKHKYWTQKNRVFNIQITDKKIPN